MFLRNLFCTLALLAAARAQIGDNADKPGFVQKPIVPRELIPPAPAPGAEESMKLFQLAAGFRLELVASEPLVQEPVMIEFAPDGKLWVVEMRGYMPNLDGEGEDAPVGRISVLTDTDGDGRYDRATVFLDGLVLPRALKLARGGALVGAPPTLWFCRDTDGDGKADERTVVATDFGVAVDPKRPFLANPERAPNSLLGAHDNWLYAAAYTKKFRWRDGAWEAAPTVFRGQWGLSQDEFGRLWHNSNSDSLRVDLIAAHYLARNPDAPYLAGWNVQAAANQLVWPARVTPGINRGYQPAMLRDGRLKEYTAACAPWIYRGDLLPADFQGNAFVAEPAANLVKRNVVRATDGAPRATEAYERREFLASTDERFRPVQVTTGPEGALYVTDLHRGVLQHRISLTSYLRAQSEDRKLAAPLHQGRIYRIVPEGKTVAGPAAYAEKNPDWLARLSHPNAWWRETAQRLLVERGDVAIAPALRRLATTGAAAEGRLHALWTLAGLDALDRATTARALDDAAPTVRAAALRLAEPWLGEPEMRARFEARRGDEAAEVRLQWVLSAGEARDAALDLAGAELARANPRQALLADALLSGVGGRETELLEKLCAAPAWAAAGAGGERVLAGLARCVVATRDEAKLARMLALAATRPVLLDGAVTDATLVTRRPIRVAAEPAGLADIRASGVAPERLARLDAMIVWPGKRGVAAVATAAEFTAEERARFEAGKNIFTATCATCHQTHGRGLDGLAPQLVDSEWVNGAPERLVRIALHGARGRIVVANRVFAGDMPAFGLLDDGQIAAVLTYVRREWGHTAGAVAPEKVREIRVATAGRNDGWSQEELMLVK